MEDESQDSAEEAIAVIEEVQEGVEKALTKPEERSEVDEDTQTEGKLNKINPDEEVQIVTEETYGSEVTIYVGIFLGIVALLILFVFCSLIYRNRNRI